MTDFPSSLEKTEIPSPTRDAMSEAFAAELEKLQRKCFEEILSGYPLDCITATVLQNGSTIFSNDGEDIVQVYPPRFDQTETVTKVTMQYRMLKP